MLHLEIAMGRLYMAYWKSSWEKLEDVIKREIKGELGGTRKALRVWVTGLPQTSLGLNSSRLKTKKPCLNI